VAAKQRACALGVVCLALLSACGPLDTPAKRVPIPPLVVTGEHEARTQRSASQVQLTLKRGFAVTLRPLPPAQQVGPALLHVAELRAAAEQIAPSFVPVGPTVELVSQATRVEASFVAGGFRVRAGHRLVLAAQRPEACVASTACLTWTLFDARYAQGRCRAELQAPVQRLQFGSVPAVVSDSAAP